LSHDPLFGKKNVKLSFGVAESGAVTHPSAKSDASDLSDCIVRDMHRWNFGVGASDEFTIKLVLTPE
jgi:hypothetical protein